MLLLLVVIVLVVPMFFIYIYGGFTKNPYIYMLCIKNYKYSFCNNTKIENTKKANNIYIYHNEITIYINTLEIESLLKIISYIEQLNYISFYLAITFGYPQLTYIYNGKDISTNINTKATILKIFDEFNTKITTTKGKYCKLSITYYLKNNFEFNLENFTKVIDNNYTIKYNKFDLLINDSLLLQKLATIFNIPNVDKIKSPNFEILSNNKIIDNLIFARVLNFDDKTSNYKKLN